MNKVIKVLVVLLILFLVIILVDSIWGVQKDYAVVLKFDKEQWRKLDRLKKEKETVEDYLQGIIDKMLEVIK